MGLPVKRKADGGEVDTMVSQLKRLSRRRLFDSVIRPLASEDMSFLDALASLAQQAGSLDHKTHSHSDHSDTYIRPFFSFSASDRSNASTPTLADSSGSPGSGPDEASNSSSSSSSLPSTSAPTILAASDDFAIWTFPSRRFLPANRTLGRPRSRSPASAAVPYTGSLLGPTENNTNTTNNPETVRDDDFLVQSYTRSQISPEDDALVRRELLAEMGSTVAATVGTAVGTGSGPAGAGAPSAAVEGGAGAGATTGVGNGVIGARVDIPIGAEIGAATGVQSPSRRISTTTGDRTHARLHGPNHANDDGDGGDEDESDDQDGNDDYSDSSDDSRDSHDSRDSDSHNHVETGVRFRFGFSHDGEGLRNAMISAFEALYAENGLLGAGAGTGERSDAPPAAGSGAGGSADPPPGQTSSVIPPPPPVRPLGMHHQGGSWSILGSSSTPRDVSDRHNAAMEDLAGVVAEWKQKWGDVVEGWEGYVRFVGEQTSHEAENSNGSAEAVGGTESEGQR
ncbi:hypothetical protein HDU93_004526 [Gonapodya sp. JEL0774]|nr:hypothetical protein HDU93_004526 [Gonapodya sp. JEL0774]